MNIGAKTDMFMQVPVVWHVILMEKVIKKVKYTIVFFIILGIFSGIHFCANAQENTKIVEGVVSYITGKSIYVKFENTGGIENGDTLFFKSDNVLIPALVVQHRSSISCLCNPVGENTFKVSDIIFGKSKVKVDLSLEKIQPENQAEQDVNEQVLTSAKVNPEKKSNEQNINGSLSISSYSNFSNTDGDDSHRLRYTFSTDAKNIGGSRLSAETYISFSHRLNHWDVVQENLNNALKVYNLALQYDFTKTATLWAGRKINPNLANVGAIDGLQFQKEWKSWFAGIAAGARPDYLDYGFNPDLFEYGAYIGQNSKVKNGFVQSSLAFFEQRNLSNIDRRFVYFQHNNSILKNVNVFSSFEFDLYRLENGLPVNSASLTSLYLSVRYRISRRLSVFGSYDNRKNVIYYETFKNYTDAVLQQASRQGLRFRINYRPVNLLNLGVNAGRRFMKNDPRATNTLNANATVSRIPALNAALTLSSNLMQTAYLDGQVYSARLSKDIVPGKFFGTLNYRWVQFNYLSVASQLRQNIGELDFSYQFNKKLYLSVNLESTFQESKNFNRVYFNLRWKF